MAVAGATVVLRTLAINHMVIGNVPLPCETADVAVHEALDNEYCLSCVKSDEPARAPSSPKNVAID